MSLISLKTTISEYESKIKMVDTKIKITKDLIMIAKYKFNERKRVY